MLPYTDSVLLDMNERLNYFVAVCFKTPMPPARPPRPEPTRDRRYRLHQRYISATYRAKVRESVWRVTMSSAGREEGDTSLP